MPPQEELEERVNNMQTSEDMPTPEEFARLSNLRAIHQEVFGIVEGYRTQNKSFRYAVRKKDTNNRLTYGLIFKGYEDYIEIGLSGCNDAMNKTRTIFLSVKLKDNTVDDVRFHVAYSGNEARQRQVYEEICTAFNMPSNKNRIDCKCVIPWDNDHDLNNTLTNWFKTKYDQLYKIMDNNNILISPKDFKDMINNQVKRGILVENNDQIRINQNYRPNFNQPENAIPTIPDNQNNKTAETKPDQVVAQPQVTDIDNPHNLIYFGAPGTGKSYKLNDALGRNFGKNNFERVTFYPTYSYAQFVGTYKPVMVQDNTGNNNGNTGREEIAYQFVPGPFLRVLTEAKRHPGTNYCLVIEEINRANAAAVFGDVFQLLDRKPEGISEYSIAASEDIKKYLENKGIQGETAQKLSIPKNMYIWATMNSADQGVSPMDTAFKRRWSFEYIEIDNEDTGVCNEWVIKGSGINWNVFRKFVNGLLSSFDVNEDKLMGPYFVKADNGTHISEKSFASKVLMYLWEDAARMIRKNIFGAEIKTYSQLVLKWNSNNIHIFDNCSDKWRNNNDLSTLYNNIITQQNAQPNTQAEGVIPVDNNIAGNTN